MDLVDIFDTALDRLEQQVEPAAAELEISTQDWEAGARAIYLALGVLFTSERFSAGPAKK